MIAKGRKRRRRISAAERRDMLLHAARKVFAERGYEGAKTSLIAQAAGVSEALLYRHFPSKRALYGAVLRQLVHSQNAVFDTIGSPSASTESLVLVIGEYLRACIDPSRAEWHASLKVLLSSLASDGSYASSVYRRAVSMTIGALSAALDAARGAGDLEPPVLSPLHAAMFIEHVGTMMAAANALPRGAAPYEGDPAWLVSDAVWFCCRGIGLSAPAITRCLTANHPDIPRIKGVPRRQRRQRPDNHNNDQERGYSDG